MAAADCRGKWQADISAGYRANAAPLQEGGRQLGRRRFSICAGDGYGRAGTLLEREFELADDPNAFGNNIPYQRHHRVDPWAENSNIVSRGIPVGLSTEKHAHAARHEAGCFFAETWIIQRFANRDRRPLFLQKEGRCLAAVAEPKNNRIFSAVNHGI